MSSNSLSENKHKIFNITKTQRMLHNKRPMEKSFTIDEDKYLSKLKTSFPEMKWSEMSCYFNNKSANLLRNHWTFTLNPKLKKGKWEREEDEIITNWVNHNGERSWSKVFIQGRTSKQIRHRYFNYLKKHSNVEWNTESENTLLKLYTKHGSRWSIISKYFNTSESNVKNKFYSLLRKQVNTYFKEIKLKDKFIDKRVSKLNKLTDSFFTESGKETEKSKRKFLSKSELIKFLPYIMNLRNISIEENSSFPNDNETSDTIKSSEISLECRDSISLLDAIPDSTQNNKFNSFLDTINDYFTLSDFSLFEFEECSIINTDSEIEHQRKTALRKVFDTLHKKKFELKKQKMLNQLKSGILLSNQIDILNDVINRIKSQTLNRVFKLFKNIHD